MSSSDIQERIEAVERLTKIFKPERIVHLFVTSLSLIVLLISAGKLLYEGKAGSVELTLMFSSSGLITYSASRLLHMWNQALRMISPDQRKKDK